jgi:hypothetical protein
MHMERLYRTYAHMYVQISPKRISGVHMPAYVAVYECSWHRN